jgi:hypothetical protein
MPKAAICTTEADAMDIRDQPDDFALLDDSALLAWRAETRLELDRLPRSAFREALSALYDASLDELVNRARRAWTQIR